MSQEQLRSLLDFYNMKKVSEVAKVNHSTLKNFKARLTNNLNDENFYKVVKAIETINKEVL